MNVPEFKPTCMEIAPLLVFYACDEVDAQERGTIEEHLAQCLECRKQLIEERNFQQALAGVPQASEQLDPSGILLAHCRSELAEKLDDWTRPAAKEKFAAFRWLRHWMVLHPAWAGAVLVLFGLVAGVEFTRWVTGRSVDTLAEAVDVRPGPRLTEDQLSKMALSGVNVINSRDPGTQNVSLQLSAEQPMELTGSLDDSDVRSVLTYVLKNGERFDPGVRLDCLDALRTRAEDGEVRSALLCAARKDQNPAVRMKALEALRDSAEDRTVRDTLLQALKHDSNPGVRVEAVNLLVRSIEGVDPLNLPKVMPGDSGLSPQKGSVTANAASDESLENAIRALEDLQRNDPSRYVRLRSAAALRQISERSDQ